MILSAQLEIDAKQTSTARGISAGTYRVTYYVPKKTPFFKSPTRSLKPVGHNGATLQSLSNVPRTTRKLIDTKKAPEYCTDTKRKGFGNKNGD